MESQKDVKELPIFSASDDNFQHLASKKMISKNEKSQRRKTILSHFLAIRYLPTKTIYGEMVEDVAL